MQTNQPAYIEPPISAGQLHSQKIDDQKDQNSSQRKQAQSLPENRCTKKCVLITAAIVFSLCAITVLIVLLIILNRSKKAEFYNLIELNSSSALCLDGSNANYKISTSGDPSKLFIYFEGGGWCSDTTDEKTLQSCYQRSFTFLGSSNQNDKLLSIDEGSLSKDPNNYFKDWKKVFFDYCDGTGHQGSRKQAIQYKNRPLFFRGYNITVERFEDLELRLGLFSKAEKVVITGESAGGLAAAMWTNYLVERVKNGKVYSFVDAGVFYDSPNLNTKTNLYKESFGNLMKISNAQIDPPVPECLLKFPNQKQNCMLAQNFLHYIKAPLFVAQSLYDIYSILQIIGAKCVYNSIASCSQEEFAIMEQNRVNVTKVLQEVAIRKQNGVWGISCLMHNTISLPLYFDAKYQVPAYSGYTLNRAVGEWLDNQQQNNARIDLSSWPNNKPCA